MFKVFNNLSGDHNPVVVEQINILQVCLEQFLQVQIQKKDSLLCIISNDIVYLPGQCGATRE